MYPSHYVETHRMTHDQILQALIKKKNNPYTYMAKQKYYTKMNTKSKQSAKNKNKF